MARDPAPQARVRLRLPRIEAKPKRVWLEGWQDHAGIGKSPSLRAEFDDIIESIGRGDGVPEKYYRAGIDRDRDGLLEELGVMHLHLGGKHSDILLFLVQYDNMVLLLESNSHIHLRSVPKGKNIAALMQSWFRELEREIAEAGQAAGLPKAEAQRHEADEHRARLAAALAKLRGRLKTFVPARAGVIHTADVDHGKPRPDGQDREEDQTLSK